VDELADPAGELAAAMTEWVEVDALLALTIKRAVEAEREWIDRELKRMLPLWDFYAWGEPSLAWHKGKFLGLCISEAPTSAKLAILMPAQPP
jgi:hypothetical protein